MARDDMKTFVLDTNVFIHKPDCILSFRDNEVVVPLWVLEELDKLKTFSDEKGRNARQAIRFLDEVGKHGDLNKGAKVGDGIILRVSFAQANKIPADLSREKVDNKILLTAMSLKSEGKKVFFVSKDINARVKATALGLKAVDYERQKVNIMELYPGWREVETSVEILDQLQRGEAVSWEQKLFTNEFVLAGHPKTETRVLGQYRDGMVRAILGEMEAVSGVVPLNEKQRMALELLQDPEIRLVSLVGKAGTGKTLLAIAAGLSQVLEQNAYKRVLVSRPVIPMGKDIGYLPGAKNEKLSHWMQPLFDNLEYILSVYKKQNIKSVDSLLNNNLLELEALTYIRGRSLPDQYIIIDEAQNLSPHEIKTIVSRAGEGTKVVLTGDPYQIDSPYLDSSSNGLTYLVETLKGQELFGHVTLDKSERSALAELAAELL
ncbi:PhoH family protein [Marispirochaeta aestuarii]|uniref:PhoH family protein n=1 Tax=Marispirochaeta aestuarii TaxID=1963862 RepID=UPI0029C8A6B0|nr:PhoH family protein [Marispirochaeta aestuarii]